MTQTEPRRWQKTVAIKATDDDERTATGAALVPFEVDRQRDYLTPAGIEAMFNPDPDDGVMHFKFADDDAELVRNEIIDESEIIGGKEYPAGSWIIRRKYLDDELYQLVQDGVLDGFSIGGEVSQEVDYALDELPEEVTFPAEVEEGPATEIQNGSTGEISDVDIPAVPNADHAQKSLEKNLVEQASGEDSFVELMEPRGHSEEDARRLWEYLQTPADKAHNYNMSTDTDDPDGASLDDVDDATLGKRFKQWWESIGGGGSDAEKSAPDPPDIPTTRAEKALTVAKEGQTLSQSNRETLMAAHDAIEAALASGMDFETNRFTDSDDNDFDIAQYGDKDEKALEKLTEEQGDLVATAVQRFVDTQGDATFGEFRDWLWQTDALDDDTMFAADEAAWQYREWTREQREEAAVSEGFVPYVMAETDTETEINMSKNDGTSDGGDADADTDKFADAPEWAKALHEQAEKNSERLDDLDKADDGDTDALEDAPEWAKTLHDQAEKNAERIDKVAKASADTEQVDGAEKNAENGESSGFKKALGSH